MHVTLTRGKIIHVSLISIRYTAEMCGDFSCDCCRGPRSVCSDQTSMNALHMHSHLQGLGGLGQNQSLDREKIRILIHQCIHLHKYRALAFVIYNQNCPVRTCYKLYPSAAEKHL